MIIPPSLNLPERIALIPLPQPVDVAATISGISAAEIAAILEAPKDREHVRLVKLARSQMRSYAARRLKEQGGLCPLCQRPIDLTIKGEGVIDHDHDTGRIRGILHRSCNAAEGKISNAAARWGAKSSRYADIIEYLRQVLRYLEAEPTQFIYPMHKTVDEKKEAVLKRKREQRAAIKAKRELAQRKRKGTDAE